MQALSKRLGPGAAAFATWAAIDSTYSAEMLGRAGYDCVVLDTQHGAIGWDGLGSLVQALDVNRVPALVRVGAVDQAQIMRALDLGAAGVIVPMVNSPEAAASAAAATRYPPAGIRSFGPVRNYYLGGDTADHPLCFAMIETAEAMQQLEAIAAVEGIDGLFVGPVDLGLGLGLGTLLEENEAVFSAIGEIVKACESCGKIPASASFSTAYSARLLALGVRLVVQGSDLGFVRRGMTADVAGFRALLDTNPETGA